MIDFSAETYVPNEIAKSFTHVFFFIEIGYKDELFIVLPTDQCWLLATSCTIGPLVKQWSAQ